mmetsp:Transcript_41062/g.68984  ORF Transcript_41062/g.68984 Transcript_41062/m.68984 type:complete len:144 (-) Transcript_41062:1186-1617(-)
MCGETGDTQTISAMQGLNTTTLNAPSMLLLGFTLPTRALLPPTFQYIYLKKAQLAVTTGCSLVVRYSLRSLKPHALPSVAISAPHAPQLPAPHTLFSAPHRPRDHEGPHNSLVKMMHSSDLGVIRFVVKGHAGVHTIYQNRPT